MTDKDELEPKIKIKKAYVYLGPNISGGILQTGHIYMQMPEHLKKITKEIPEIKKLFVEVKDVPKFKANLQKPGTEEYRLFEYIKNELGRSGSNVL